MEAQLKLAKLKPPNYGILTAILMHLIRSVSVTPMRTPAYVNQALVSLNFGPMMERFGMGFLHDLDLEIGNISGVASEDDDVVKHAMKQARKSKARKVVVTPPTDLEANFPLGPSPPWTQVVSTICDEPASLMREWRWIDHWDSNETASGLFTQMTTDIWLILNEKVIYTPPGSPHPKTLKEAMEVWTIEFIQKTVICPTFKASNAGLQGGKTGQKQLSFSSMTDIFFPKPLDGAARSLRKSHWLPLINGGYIKRFHKYQNTYTEERFENLMVSLRLIFKNIQCLPMAQQVTIRSSGRIWKSLQGKVEFITNPEFYRLQSIGTTQRKTTSSSRIKASNAVVITRLAEEHRGVPYKDARKTARRSARARNFRIPPSRSAKKSKAATTTKDYGSDCEGSESSEVGKDSEPNERKSGRARCNHEDGDDSSSGEDGDSESVDD